MMQYKRPDLRPRPNEIEELAQLLFHTFYGHAPSFCKESEAVKKKWRQIAEAAFAHTRRFVIDRENEVGV